MKTGLAVLALCWVLSINAAGAVTGAGHGAAGEQREAGPVVPNHADWGPTLLWIIGALFLGAIAVGPFYRRELPEEPQTDDFHSHDEPPGASRHHGASGTIDHSAPDGTGHH